MTPKISIIIPVYNTETYLRECLDSVINQTLKDIEIIIVNDCSPDNSESIILEYLAKDPRIKYIKHEQNLGLGGARNTGITNAKGNWIAFVDSDDYIELNTYSTMLSLMDKHQVNLGVFSVINFDHLTKIETYDPYFDTNFSTPITFNNQNITYTCPTAWNKIFKLSDLISHNLRFPEHLKHEDEEFWFKYIVTIEPLIVGSNKKLYHYRQRVDSIMGQKHLSRKYFPQICLNIYLFLQQNNKESLYRQYFFSSILQYIYEQYQETDPMYKSIFQQEMQQLLHYMKISKKELEQYPNLNLFYVDNPISQEIIYNYISLSSNSSHDKWYCFGQLSRTQKIKKILIVLSKKIKIYPVLKKIFTIIRK